MNSLALAISNSTLIAIVCVLAIIALALFIFGRR
jgi:hypothetical protein